MKGERTSERRRRGDGGYHPMVGNWQSPPVEVDASQFVTQADAARWLGISALRIGGLIGEGRLTPVLRNGEAGVSTESLAQEVDLRRRQPVRARLRSIFHWLSF